MPYISFFRPDNRSQLTWQTGLSGIEGSGGNGGVRESFAKAQQFASRHGISVTRNLLPMRPFAHVFEEHGIQLIDFLSIDVEGAELELLQTIDFVKVKVRVIAIEMKESSDELRNRTALVGSLLRRSGFVDIGVRTRLSDQIWISRTLPLA